MYNRICRQCGINFLGGPRAWYCPNCRAERKREANARFLAKGRRADRPLGSIDQCVICNGDYIVNASPQRYCPACAPVTIAAVDRTQSLEYYHKNSHTINPVRKIKRRNPFQETLMKCTICGREFLAHDPKQTICGDDDCRRARQREYDRRRKK